MWFSLLQYYYPPHLKAPADAQKYSGPKPGYGIEELVTISSEMELFRVGQVVVKIGKGTRKSNI